MKPILKWAGGKRRLLPHIIPLAARGYSRYYEPMVGAGAIFFGLSPRQAVIGDLNPHLIRTYQAIQRECGAVIRALRQCQESHCKDFYEDMRRKDPAGLSNVEVAAWLIYLNKTCFNGLYRVNKGGKFNVPMGRYENPNICDEEALTAAARVLRHTQLSTMDFEIATQYAGSEDFVYFDPPYAPVSATSDFTAFTAEGFTAQDQVRLRDTALRLSKKGASVAVSNSDTPFVRDLYQDFEIKVLKVPRAINSKASKRGAVNELLMWRD